MAARDVSIANKAKAKESLFQSPIEPTINQAAIDAAVYLAKQNCKLVNQKLPDLEMVVSAKKSCLQK